MRKKINSWIGRIITFFIGFGVLLILIHYVGYEKFLNIVLQTSPYWIVASVIIYAISWLFRILRLEKFTILTGNNINRFNLFKLYISSYALNVILPAKIGDIAMIGYLKMEGIKIGRSVAIILQTRILDVLALFLLSIPSFIFLFKRNTLEWIWSTIFIGILIVAVPIGIVILDKNKIISGILEKLKDRCNYKILILLVEKTRDTYEGYHEIVSNKKLLVVSILLSLMIWLFEALTCYTVSIAVGAQIPIIIVILAVSIANVGKCVPATPGAIGLYESIFVTVSVLFGISFDIAVVIAIVDHLIKNLFILVIGVPATAGIGVDISKITVTE